MDFIKGLVQRHDVPQVLGKAVENVVESQLKNFLGDDEQKDDGGKEDKGGLSFGKLFSSGDDGQKDVNEESPSGGQTDEDNSGFGLANALISSCGDGDADNGGLGSGDAKGGGQKNDDNTGAGEPGIDAAAAALGDLFDQQS